VLVPSDENPSALSVLQKTIVGDAVVRAAVAFVTRSGVGLLASILEGAENVTVEVVARAANVTEPEALLALRDELGADVSVVIGRQAQAFHPKLWLIERDGGLAAISGSGNLTEGGLVTNDEQFEVVEYEAGDPKAAAQHDRFELLTRHAQPLDTVEDAAIWREWLDVRKMQSRLRTELARIEKNLNARDPIPNRSADKTTLIEDLQRIYDDTVAADLNLNQADGRRHYPTRLLVAINRARDRARDPVKLVTDTIRRHTDGLDILLESGRVDLTLEWLVLDESKPYHDLFGIRSIELARGRIEAFRRAGHTIPDLAAQAAQAQAAVPAMRTPMIGDYLRELLRANPDGHELPLLHGAQATLIRVDAGHAVVRRDSGSEARIPLSYVRRRLLDLAGGARPKQSELAEQPGDRFTAVLGPLLAALPGVGFDGDAQRLYYDEAEP
jgi:HKD family nuclease